MNAWCRIFGGIALLVAAGAAGCGGAAPPAPGNTGPVRVAATIAPLALVVRGLVEPELAGLVEVTTVVPAGATPHGFDPAPSQMAQVARADLVVMVGLGLDDWAPRAAGSGKALLRLGDVLGGQGAPDAGTEPHERGPHGSIDPHLWVDPAAVAQFVERLAGELAPRLGPAAAGRLAAAKARFLGEVAAADARTRTALAPYRDAKLITFHDSLHRYAARYRLSIAAVLRPIEGVEPAPADLKDAIREVEDHRIGAIFIEPEFNAIAAERIASAARVHLVTIDPLGTRAPSWVAMMDALAANVSAGLAGGR